MCVYYIYIYIYVCVYVCMYVCMYVYMYVCVCVRVCVCLCIYICMYVCMYVRTYVCMYVCMCKHRHAWHRLIITQSRSFHQFTAVEITSWKHLETNKQCRLRCYLHVVPGTTVAFFIKHIQQ